MENVQEKLKKANKFIEELEKTKKQNKINVKIFEQPFKIGVDLGTSNIVIVVLDQKNNPVAFEIESANVVKDGIVVQYLEAVKILEKMKKNLERRLNLELFDAATAIPPGIMEGNTKVICNVVQAAGFNVIKVIDEPIAASIMLGIDNGIVVDIGGGTTGISSIKKGEVEYSVDEATGGTHMTLVIAGAMDIDIKEAEKFKTNFKNYNVVFPIVEPVIDKMASITDKFIEDKTNPIFLAGGTSGLKGIEDIFEKRLKSNVYKLNNPILITPIGIAMSI